MVEIGTILSNGVTIYLVNKINEDNTIVAQICGGTPASFSPVPGALITLTEQQISSFKKIGKVNEV